eukprot:GHVT01060178.1.p1 GENE.GHVT01060178.1~~GHVT01060178.1.p1  ORF type:complete len:120 (+),score=16.94 GHVT01060178.1:406-765(+)
MSESETDDECDTELRQPTTTSVTGREELSQPAETNLHGMRFFPPPPLSTRIAGVGLCTPLPKRRSPGMLPTPKRHRPNARHRGGETTSETGTIPRTSTRLHRGGNGALPDAQPLQLAHI